MTTRRGLGSVVWVLLVGELASGDVRILGESGSPGVSGILEVNMGGEWGQVCDFKFGHNEKLVACREMGFKSYQPYCGASINSKSLIIAFNVHCSKGTQGVLPKRLDECDGVFGDTARHKCLKAVNGKKVYLECTNDTSKTQDTCPKSLGERIMGVIISILLLAICCSPCIFSVVYASMRYFRTGRYRRDYSQAPVTVHDSSQQQEVNTYASAVQIDAPQTHVSSVHSNVVPPAGYASAVQMDDVSQTTHLQSRDVGGVQDELGDLGMSEVTAPRVVRRGGDGSVEYVSLQNEPGA
ncbi:hypothetical protein AAMO2058_000479600 [Amorphochlora amoebiformis]